MELTRLSRRPRAARAASVLTLAGAVNLPIVKFSVDWWNTLHQGSIFRMSSSTVDGSILVPLLVMAVGFTLLFATLRYGLSYISFNYASRSARFSYRLAFLAAAVTYGIVVYKAYRARVRAGKPNGILGLVADENVQYLRMFPSSNP